MENKTIKSIMVVGGGTMGEGIVQNFAQAGYKVILASRRQETLDRCLKQVTANLNTFKEFGLINESSATIMSRVQAILDKDLINYAKSCDYIVETISEILEDKRAIFSRLDEIPEGIVIASNTGSFTMTTLAEGLKTPQRFIGTHYFNPAHIIPAVEVHRGVKTDDSAVETTRQLLIKIGKKPIMVRKIVPGFIINRLTGAMEREVDYLLDEGIVTPEDLDIAVKSSFGFRLACLGPMEAEDMIGLDTSARVSDRVYKVLSNRTDASPSLLEKVKKGELGIKSGKGWYDYSAKTREQVLDTTNRKLLQQLALFKQLNP
jgi:3-hydroxybutyryl-CoA dehydrogenase